MSEFPSPMKAEPREQDIDATLRALGISPNENEDLVRVLRRRGPGRERSRRGLFHQRAAADLPGTVGGLSQGESAMWRIARTT